MAKTDQEHREECGEGSVDEQRELSPEEIEAVRQHKMLVAEQQFTHTNETVRLGFFRSKAEFINAILLGWALTLLAILFNYKAGNMLGVLLGVASLTIAYVSQANIFPLGQRGKRWALALVIVTTTLSYLVWITQYVIALGVSHG
jgi:hypothetical protein